MDASMTSVVPGSFYFYNPDPNPDARHHGYFVPHPQQMPNMYAAAPMPTLPSTPIYSRPTSSSSAQHQQYQPQHQHQHQVLMPQPPALKSFTGVPNNMLTPMPSPPAGAATALGSNGQQQQQHHLQLQLQQHYHYQHQQQQLQLQHHAKPTIMLETDVYDADGMRYPSTPPLSTASSAISSPGSCDMLVTPLNPMFSGLENSDNLKKTACVSDSNADSYPIAGWTNSASPPLTPAHTSVYAQAPARTQSANTSAPVSDTQTPAVLSSDLLSVSACPSLSPSPSAYARSVASEQDNDFCDPRNLTVSSVDGLSEFSASAAPSSSLCAAGETDTSQAAESVPASVGDGSGGASASSAGDFVVHHGLPNLDEYPDLESEDEFVNGLVNLGAELSPLSHAGTPSLDGLSSRSRASSITSSITSGFELFDAWGSTVDGSEDAQHPTKRQRTASGSVLIMSSSPSSSLAADAMTTSMTGGSSEQPSEEGHHGHHGHHDHHDHHEHDGSSSNSPSSSGSDRDSNDNTNRDDGHSAGGSSGNADSPDEGGNNDASTAPTATSRRGRKQSLTDDPSKIFACDLCNRKFRRQEHLKRHYRSLHTQDKPFNCEECGKKFSRSDNLAQHARTHGAAAFVMNLYDDPDMMAAAGAGYPPHPLYAPHPMPMGEDYASMGRVLFQVAAEIPGSASELSSEDGNDNQGKKKRKRSN